MNRTTLTLCALIFIFLSGCGSDTPSPTAVVPVPSQQPAVVPTSDGNTEGPAPTAIEPNPTAVEPNPTAVDVAATPTAVVLNTLVPTPSQPAVNNDPIIDNLVVSAGVGGEENTIFETPQNEVFLRFDYDNLQDGAVLQRNWFLNGLAFISKDEVWDTGLHGADGTRFDISIFDFETGLTPGRYRVELLLDGVIQGSADFLIVPVERAGQPPLGERFRGLYFRGVGAGTNEINDILERPDELFAVWDYQDMLAGDTIRRDWYFNDALFITREEEWDMAKYGSIGIVEDVSIFDFETGLNPGIYRLELFVNDSLQISREVEIIEVRELAPITDPASGKVAQSDGLSSVLVTNPDGGQQTIALSGRLRSIDWVPNGDRLIAVTNTVIDPTIPIPTFSIQSEAWLIDLASGGVTQLSVLDENFHSPQVSPNGRFIAFLSGSGYGDACGVDLRLAVIQLDGSAVGETYSVSSFAQVGIEFEPEFASTFLNLEENAFRPLPGVWVDDNTLETRISFNDCQETFTYHLDLTDLTIQKVDQ